MKKLILICSLALSSLTYAKSASEANILRTIFKHKGTYWGFQCLKTEGSSCEVAQLVSFKGTLNNVKDLRMENYKTFDKETVKDRFRVAGGDFSQVRGEIEASQFSLGTAVLLPVLVFYNEPVGFQNKIDKWYEVVLVSIATPVVIPLTIGLSLTGYAIDLITLPWRAVRKGKMLKAQRKMRETDIDTLFTPVSSKKEYTVVKVPGKYVFKTLKETLLKF